MITTRRSLTLGFLSFAKTHLVFSGCSCGEHEKDPSCNQVVGHLIDLYYFRAGLRVPPTEDTIKQFKEWQEKIFKVYLPEDQEMVDSFPPEARFNPDNTLNIKNNRWANILYVENFFHVDENSDREEHQVGLYFMALGTLLGLFRLNTPNDMPCLPDFLRGMLAQTGAIGITEAIKAS